MYTSVFIQDEYTHEVINCAKARNYYAYEKIQQPAVTDNSIPLAINEFPTAIPLNPGSGLEIETMENTVPPPGWSIQNPDSNMTFWQYIYAAVSGPSYPGARSIRISLFTYTENIGTKDYLKSKVYNNISPNDTIRFDYAYAQRPGYDNDRLTVKVSLDGGSTFPYTIFDKQGATLGTAPAQTTSFVPTAGQWGTFATKFSSLSEVNTSGNFTPLKFELLQNYPNPFNPSTNIKYQITNNSYVTLKVYDILGRVVESLVNEKQSPGVYEVKWDGSYYSNGVYFYKLTADGFSETKKMILIK